MLYSLQHELYDKSKVFSKLAETTPREVACNTFTTFSRVEISYDLLHDLSVQQVVQRQIEVVEFRL